MKLRFCIVNNVSFVFCFKAHTTHSKISFSYLIGSGEEHVNFLIAINKINLVFGKMKCTPSAVGSHINDAIKISLFCLL